MLAIFLHISKYFIFIKRIHVIIKKIEKKIQRYRLYIFKKNELILNLNRGEEIQSVNLSSTRKITTHYTHTNSQYTRKGAHVDGKAMHTQSTHTHTEHTLQNTQNTTNNETTAAVLSDKL